MEYIVTVNGHVTAELRDFYVARIVAQDYARKVIVESTNDIVEHGENGYVGKSHTHFKVSVLARDGNDTNALFVIKAEVENLVID